MPNPPQPSSSEYLRTADDFRARANHITRRLLRFPEQMQDSCVRLIKHYQDRADRIEAGGAPTNG